MAFSEQLQQLCTEVSEEQAVTLREFIVHLTEQTDAKPGLLNISLKTLMQEATDEGFDTENLLVTLQQLAKAAVTVEDQARFAAELEPLLAGNAIISEITALISSSYPGLKAQMFDLVEAAKSDRRTLTGVAGGTSHNGDFKKTWQKTPNATKKQKWEKAGIDALEIFTGLSLINYGAFTYREKAVATALINDVGGGGKVELHGNYGIGKGEFRHRKVLGMVYSERKFDNWFSKEGRINFEINRFLPGGYFRALHQERERAAANKPLTKESGTLDNSTGNNFSRTSVMDNDISDKSALLGQYRFDVRRFERAAERMDEYNNIDYHQRWSQNSSKELYSPGSMWQNDKRSTLLLFQNRESAAISEFGQETQKLEDEAKRSLSTDVSEFEMAEESIIEFE